MKLLHLILAYVVCGQSPEEPKRGTAERGVIFFVDGVGGWNLAPRLVSGALAAAEVPHEVQHFYWSHGFGSWYLDLTNEENLRRKGTELADRISEFRDEHPDRPVYLIAKSGGTAVALRAMAELPAESIERAVFLSAAVSPTYDLVPALRAIRTELVSFWSPKDKLILGFGTTVFGTADGVLGESAGLVGFRTPEEQEAAAAYRKLRQVTWEPAMKKTYNFGTHMGTSMPQFIREYVAPLVGGRSDANDAAYFTYPITR